MGILEIFATVFTLLCGFFAVKRNTLQYPVGIVGTILYFFVFWQANLFFSAALQVFFTAVQIYGWWYWNYGNKGEKPRITKMDWLTYVIVVFAGTAFFTISTMWVAGKVGAASPLLDSAIFSLSVLAQLLLDRKKMQNWLTWAMVNVISVPVYYSQGLTLTAGIYAILLVNTAWGYYEWNKEFKSYDKVGN